MFPGHNERSWVLFGFSSYPEVRPRMFSSFISISCFTFKCIIMGTNHFSFCFSFDIQHGVYDLTNWQERTTSFSLPPSHSLPLSASFQHLNVWRSLNKASFYSPTQAGARGPWSRWHWERLSIDGTLKTHP